MYNEYMEENVCSMCHVMVRPTDYFCYNCGKNLHQKPPSITLFDQVMLYLGSIFLAPMGVIWGIRYIRQEDQKSKIVGLVAMTLSVIVIIVVLQYTLSFLHSVSSQVGSGVGGIGGF